MWTRRGSRNHRDEQIRPNNRDILKNTSTSGMGCKDNNGQMSWHDAGGERGLGKLLKIANPNPYVRASYIDDEDDPFFAA